MKHYVDKVENRRAWFLILFFPVFPVGALVSLLRTNEVDSHWIYGIVILYPAVFLLCYLDRRNSSYVKIKESTIDSYSIFGKKYCTVSLDQIVYFIPFEAYRAKARFLGEYKSYIALSNHPFTYDYPTKADNFIAHYDLHTMIVLPYDDKTKPLLPVDKWIQVV